MGFNPTYDLQIEDDHNFLANNLIVHNSHATSFALLAYDSAWLKYYEPAAFTCALLNSQPMGFYAPAQLVRDAKDHEVEVRPVTIADSDWDCTLEPRVGMAQSALRLGLRLARSLSETAARRIMAARMERPFVNAQELTERAALGRGELEALAAAGVLAGLSGHRHLAFWEVAGTMQPLPLAPADAGDGHFLEGQPLLKAPTERQNIEADLATLGLTLGRHPVALLREQLQAESLSTAADLAALPPWHLRAYRGHGADAPTPTKCQRRDLPHHRG